MQCPVHLESVPAVPISARVDQAVPSISFALRDQVGVNSLGSTRDVTDDKLGIRREETHANNCKDEVDASSESGCLLESSLKRRDGQLLRWSAGSR